MHRQLGVLALAGLTAALPTFLEVVPQARSLPVGFDVKALLARDVEPCKILSDAYKAAYEPDTNIHLDVPPSVGVACLKSIPVDKKRDLELLEYLVPYIEFLSTIEVLDDPPEEYLLPGVDILGGIEVIRSKLKVDGYSNQYDVLKELQSLFLAAHEGHLYYSSALLNVIAFARPGFELVSLSSDGIRTPEIFMASAAIRGSKGELDYYPSAISSIDDTPVSEWIEDISMFQGSQDPDALYNTQLFSLPKQAGGLQGPDGARYEIPDSHTIKFRNGSEVVIHNQVIILATSNFTDIENGDDVHTRFEIPQSTSTATEQESTSTATGTPTSASTSATPTTDHITGYPYPVVKDSLDRFSGYFLNDTGYEDVAVLSILGFTTNPEPVGDAVMAFFEAAREVVISFLKAAHADGRDKLVIDVQANGGGLLILVREVYRLLFPDGKFTAWERWHATPYFDVASKLDYKAAVEPIFDGYLPVDVNGDQVTNPDEWYGPYALVDGQNMTDACQTDYSQPYQEGTYYNGYKKNSTAIPKALFKPENIVILTDGYCASACTILTGLLTRNYGIRTVALGGRPSEHAMQAMGGTKGTLAYARDDILSLVATFIETVKGNKKAVSTLEKVSDSLPSTDNPPLQDQGMSVNGLSSYTVDELDGYPVQFRYEAANCRLFYTQEMTVDMSEQWRRTVDVAWNGAKCVPGSTTNSDGTIGDDTVKYKKSVRSTAKPITNPGWPSK